MSFKIDTKEKFTVITPLFAELNANVAEALWEAATEGIGLERGNTIVNMQQIQSADRDGVNDLASLQQHFSAAKKSFVLCAVQPEVMTVIKNEDLEDGLNITPTLSEAYDIVQMEEMERELMDDFEGKEDELNP